MANDLIKKATHFWSNIRADSEALFEMRQLIVGILIIIALGYGGYVFYIEAKEKVNHKKLSYKKELAVSLGGDQMTKLTDLQLLKLKKSKDALLEKIELLQFKDSILREQYVSSGNSEPFTNVIFTLLPISPVEIEKGFIEMNVLDAREHDLFQINPIKFKGKIGYSGFINYLQYLEERHEVGMIGDLSLELLAASPFSDEIEVQFDVELGRIQLLPAE